MTIIMSQHKERLIILGSGPAGLTAGIYAARGGVPPLLVAGYAPGGQLMNTTDVENFPGFEEPILGPKLMDRMIKQAIRMGVKMMEKDATSVNLKERPFKVVVEDEIYLADSMIVALGAKSLELNIPSENALKGRGVSYCAVCDGAFFKGGNICVVGGGDTAIEDALYLTRLARQVTVIHRRDQLRASAIMQQRAFNEPKIRFIWNSVVKEVLGGSRVEGMKLLNLKDNTESTIQCDAVFVDIGHKPNTDIFQGQLELTEKGYIAVHDKTGTSVEGVFVAGDVADSLYRQAVSAAGDGCKAALDALRYLETH